MAHYSRAALSLQLGDADTAIAAYNAALDNDPSDLDALYQRGVAYLYSGAPAKAASDFDEVVTQNRGDGQAVLWRDIAERRDGWPGQLGEAVSSLDMGEWPAPIVRFYLGQSTSDDAIAAANDEDSEVRQNQLCEAHIFIGEHALLMDDKAEARRQFERARDTCSEAFTDYSIALAELRRLDADQGN